MNNLELINLLKELGLSGVAIYLMLRMDNKLNEIIKKIGELKT